jgi:type IV fimbrial biogenesis protein FimT
LMAETEVRARSSALTVALASARMRAVETRRPVTLCARAGTGSCRSGPDWSLGWLVFDDPRGRGQLVAPDSVRHTESFDDAPVRVTSTMGRPVVTFRADGSSAGSNVTLTICHSRQPGVGRQVIVSNVGRARIGPLPGSWVCAF